jgi:hypothetical protein
MGTRVPGERFFFHPRLTGGLNMNDTTTVPAGGLATDETNRLFPPIRLRAHPSTTGKGSAWARCTLDDRQIYRGHGHDLESILRDGLDLCRCRTGDGQDQDKRHKAPEQLRATPLLRRQPPPVRAACLRWSLPHSGGLRCARASRSGFHVPAISPRLPAPARTSTDAARVADQQG